MNHTSTLPVALFLSSYIRAAACLQALYYDMQYKDISSL